MNFWKKLPQPFLALAPMEDVTDSVFRRIVGSIGKPDVCFTEFTSVDAIEYALRHSQKSLLAANLRSAPLRMDFAGVPPALMRLVFSDEEKPIVAQLWGVDPRKFYEAAKVIRELGFDGVDINLGCPVRDVVKLGACSAMIGNNERVSEIIRATKEGAGGLPVSVKTRLGFRQAMTESWVGFLLEQELAAITIHGRTAVQMSEGQADWGEIGKAVKLRDKSKSKSLVIGNGDVNSRDEALRKIKDHGVDGVMIGRGVLKNLCVFSPDPELGPRQKIQKLGEHLRLWANTWGETKNISGLKRYIKVYVNGFEGASLWREQLMAHHTWEHLSKAVHEKLEAME